MQPIYEPGEDSFLFENCLKSYGGVKALEIGTGSGILARALSRNFKEVVAVDINPLAKERVKGIRNCTFVLSNLFRNVRGKFDLIVFNPPYLPEGDGDLRYDCGKKGKVIRRFFQQAQKHLYGNGKILFLLSSFSPILPDDIRALGYDVRKIGEKKVSWETLSVYEAEITGSIGFHFAKGLDRLRRNLNV